MRNPRDRGTEFSGLITGGSGAGGVFPMLILMTFENLFYDTGASSDAYEIVFEG